MKYYRTKDFGLATILSYMYEVKKFEVVSEKDKKVCYFCFSDDKDFQEDLKDSLDKKMRVEPFQFIEKQNQLRRRMYIEIGEK